MTHYFIKYKNIRMTFSRVILLLHILILLLAIPSKMVMAEPGVVGLPKKAEWLPGKIKRDENGHLYLSTPEVKNKTIRKSSTVKTTQSRIKNTRTLYKNWITLNWLAPTKNMDGSKLEDLSGYKIFYWTDKNNSKKVLDVGNVVKYRINKLNYGETYFFAVTSYTRKGLESPYSKIISAKFEEPTK